MATRDTAAMSAPDSGGDTAAAGTQDPDTTDLSPEPSKPQEILVALIALAFTVTMLVLSMNVELRAAAKPGQIDARFWPTVLAGIGVGLSAWRLGIAILRPADERQGLERIQPGGYSRLAITIALTIAYIAAWSIGSVSMMGYRIQLFPIITALMFSILVWAYGGRKWTALVLYPVAVTALIYVLFGMLLRIPL